MRYVRGRDENGAAMELDDPLAGTLRRAAERADGATGLVRALAATDAVFGADLGRQAPFLDAVAQALDALDRQGTRGFLAQYRV